MDIKEMVNNAKNEILEKLGLSEQEKEQKFEVTATLEDGTVVFTPEEEWAQGVAVFTRNADGEPVSVSDGEYTLEDGRILVVAEGVLAEIREAEQPEAEESPEDMSAVAEALSAIADAFNTKLEEIKADFTAQLNELKEENATMKEALSKIPAGNSTKKAPKATQQPVKLAKDPILRIHQTLQSFKN